jgi:hypothetical protein
MGKQDSRKHPPFSLNALSVDTWSVVVALALAALVRLGLIKTVPW